MRIGLAGPGVGHAEGTTTYLRHLQRLLEQDPAHEVTVWRPAGTPDGEGVLFIRQDVDLSTRQDGMLERGKDFLSYAEMTGEVDVLHIVHLGTLPTGPYKRFVLDTPPLPLVLSVHDPHEMDCHAPYLIALCERAHRVVFIGERFMAHVGACGYLTDWERKAVFGGHPYVPLHTEAPFGPGRVQDKVICTSVWRPHKGIGQAIAAADHLRSEHRPVLFWTGQKAGYLADIIAYSTMADPTSWLACGAWEWPEDVEKVFGPAGVLSNLTTFGPRDTGRTEYTVLEAWDHGVMPVVRADFARAERAAGGIANPLVPGRNCVTVKDPSNPKELAFAYERAFDENPGWSELHKNLEPFSSAAMRERYVDAYAGAIENHRRAFAAGFTAK